MKKTITGLLVTLLIFTITGCQTRSISDSGYYQGWYGREAKLQSELTELDILGTVETPKTSEEEISKAFEMRKNLHLHRGAKVLLIQSGAMMPDPSMLEVANSYFNCAPFTGLATKGKEQISTSLRLRAAQGGYDFLICYWGTLESGIETYGSSALSWLPIVGSVIPDSKEHMRISLKAIILDVRTGSWKMNTYQSSPIDRQSYGLKRESTDQKMVFELKKQGYAELVKACLQE